MEDLLRQIVWPTSPEHRCPYLKDRQAREEMLFVGKMDPDAYLALMSIGWRRSGCLFYRPACRGCRECIPIRVPVQLFRLSRSQRRVWRRNQNVEVTVAPPECTDEKHALYVRFLNERHHGEMSDNREDMEDFLYASPVNTLEFCYRLGGELIGVGVVDIFDTASSTVYFFFDPSHDRRSLGTFSLLWELDWAKRQGLRYHYLGYTIRGLSSMSYKMRFRPHELLLRDGEWHRQNEAWG